MNLLEACMSGEITRKKSPEEVELEAKQAELAAIEEEMSSLQLEFSTLESQLQAFNSQYLQRFGEKFLYLDELKAKIAAAYAALSPEDKEAVKEAQEAAEQARETAEEVGEYVRPDIEPEPFEPSADLKAKFREVAKAVHPDLAVDDPDRKRREQLMAEANTAYKEGDEKRLQEILDAAELSKPLEDGEDVGQKLVRLIRMISSARDRMQAIRSDIEAMQAGEASSLYGEYQDQGEQLFEAIEQNLDAEIKEFEGTLSSLEAKLG